MKLKKCNSLQVAEKVLVELKQLFKKDLTGELYVESYQNGREQGLAIDLSGTPALNKYIAWSEARGSDNIVVHVCKINPCQGIMDGQLVASEYFKSVKPAAQYIYEMITGFRQLGN